MSEALVALARKAQQQAYAPYSGFRVGAAVEAEDGTTFMGCNIENASYGLTICAERAAVAAAVTAGHRRITRVAVVTDTDPPSAPCGACRQVLSEFGPALTVIAAGPRGERRWSMQQLLPDAFGPQELA